VLVNQLRERERERERERASESESVSEESERVRGRMPDATQTNIQPKCSNIIKKKGHMISDTRHYTGTGKGHCRLPPLQSLQSLPPLPPLTPPGLTAAPSHRQPVLEPVNTGHGSWAMRRAPCAMGHGSWVMGHG
jgi:hypothetical protein